MKTRPVIFTFNVPSWVPSWTVWTQRLRVAIATWKFQRNPMTCHDCGTKINFRFPNVTYQGDGKKRVMLHQLGSRIEGLKENEGICGQCLAARIKAKFLAAKPLRGRYASQGNSISRKTGTLMKTCDCCGERKPCMDIVWDDDCNIRFGSQWWNGHWMCGDCLTEAAQHGAQLCDVSSWFGGIAYQMNEKGAAIPYDGSDVSWWKVLTNNKSTEPLTSPSKCCKVDSKSSSANKTENEG